VIRVRLSVWQSLWQSMDRPRREGDGCKGIAVIEAAGSEIVVPVKELHRIVAEADKLAG
jgi:hypothetical protein